MDTEIKPDLALSIINDFMYQDQIQSFPSVKTAKKYGLLTGEYMIFTDDGIMKPQSEAERQEIISAYGKENIEEINSLSGTILVEYLAKKHAYLQDEVGKNWIKLIGEEERIYEFSHSDAENYLRIKEPVLLHIDDDKSHRVIDSSDKFHFVPYKWQVLKILRNSNKQVV